MGIIQIAMIGIGAVALALMVKQQKSEYALYLSLSAVVLILVFSMNRLQVVMETIRKIEQYTGIDVAIGIDYNLKNHASAGKIVYDIGVDVAVSGGLSVASFAAGAAIGTACCPIVGTIVGVGISVVGYLIFDEWGLRNGIKDCVQ